MNYAWWAERLLFINLAWYLVLFMAFMLSGNLGKMMYFAGAAILTVGVILM